MLANVILVTPQDDRIARLAAEANLKVVGTWTGADLDAPATGQDTSSPEVLLIDVRSQTGLPPQLEAFRRHHPSTSLVVLASTLNVMLLREAMHMGVSECLGEPFSAVELQEAVERLLTAKGTRISHGKVLAFTGARGGIGTTTIAVNVAAALAARPNASVVYVDLMLQEPGDAALFFGVEPRYSMMDVLNNLHRLDSAFLRGLVAPASSGVDVIAAPVQPPSAPPAPDAVRTLVRWLAGHYRHVIIDMPRPSREMLDALESMSAMTLVVVQELAAVRGGAPIATLLRQAFGKDRVHLVLNRYDPDSEIGRDDLERIVGLPVKATLPSDHHAAVSAINVGKPLALNSRNRLGRALVELADTLDHAATDHSGAPAELVGAVAAIS